MKKFLGILAIAAVFASCDNAASDSTKEDSARRADSIKRVEDSIKNATPVTPTMPDSNMNKMNGTDTGANKMTGTDTSKTK